MPAAAGHRARERSEITGRGRVVRRALAATLGVSQRVHFAGHHQDTAPFYAGFDIFALSSDTEQMPLSVIEAMAAGLPVVATDVGDVRLMLAAENLPFVTRLDDDAPGGLIGGFLGGALAGLLADPGLRRRIGLANLEKARRDFDQAAMFAAYGALWRGDQGVPAAGIATAP